LKREAGANAIPNVDEVAAIAVIVASVRVFLGECCGIAAELMRSSDQSRPGSNQLQATAALRVDDGTDYFLKDKARRP
jgi:hypothetical protein